MAQHDTISACRYNSCTKTKACELLTRGTLNKIMTTISFVSKVSGETLNSFNTNNPNSEAVGMFINDQRRQLETFFELEGLIDTVETPCYEEE